MRRRWWRSRRSRAPSSRSASSSAIDLAGATSAKLVVDGAYAGEDDAPPLQFAVDLPPGEHRAVVRAIVDVPDDPDTEARVDSRFTVSADAPTAIAPPAPPATAATINAAGELVVTTPDQLREALATAAPGEVIRLADGEYRFDQRLEASASGTGRRRSRSSGHERPSSAPRTRRATTACTSPATTGGSRASRSPTPPRASSSTGRSARSSTASRCSTSATRACTSDRARATAC